jgi:hypothetical protein
MLNLCFASGEIYGSHSALWCVQGAKYQSTIFDAQVGAVRVRQKACRTHYTEFVFLHPVGSAGHIVCFDASGVQNVDTLFFMLWCARCGFHKKRIRTSYAKHVFLHPVGSTGHVVHPGHETHTHFFHARVGRMWFPQKACQDTLRQTCVFVFGEICGSRSAFWCVRDVKCRCTIFYAWVGPLWFPQKARRVTLNLCFLHSVGSAGHVVHSCASEPQNIDALFFLLRWARFDMTKSASRHVTPNLCFLLPV